jgi:hypothetical protein
MLDSSVPLSRREAHARRVYRVWPEPDPARRAEAAPTRQLAHPDARDRGIDHQTVVG